MGSLMLSRVLSLQALALLSLMIGCVVCKECTNEFPWASHTYRYALLTSKNETWKKEVLSHMHDHLTPSDDSYWANLLPRRMVRQEDQISWMMLYKQIKGYGGPKGNAGYLNPVPLNDVRLDPNSIHGIAQQTNLQYLLMLDVDRLLWSFRRTAGLPTPGQPYGGWEKPDVELRGHFVGHYLSATAQMWASTNHEEIKSKMSAVVSGLSKCQKAMGSGYLSAFPSEEFDRVEALKRVWAPYYTIHKIMAGLLDQYTFAGNEGAFKMLKWMVDYHYNRVQNVIQKYSIQRHWSSLNEEVGGMNDILYRLYMISGDSKHLMLAHLFDKPCFLGVLALQADDISGFHTNTHTPLVVGAQMRYEATGDPLYKEIATFFVDAINSSHSYATGGMSFHEFWSDPKRLATTLQTENEESCTTYNLLKVTRNLFRWTKEIRYADYYERALTNGVLSIQRGRQPGVMIYMLPLKPGSSKAVSYHKWGTPDNDFWCCYGTGIESFSKLGDTIYFEEGGNVPGLYIIQYISSSFNWKTGGFQLHQTVNPVVSWDNRLQVTITIASVQAAKGQSTLHLRIPSWSNTNGAKALLNNKKLDLPAAGNYLSVTKQWSPGYEINLVLPISLKLEAIKDDRPEYASLHAFIYGPYLLAGLSDGDNRIKAASGASLTDWITPIQSKEHDHVITISRGPVKSCLVATHESIRLQKFPEAGTNDAVYSTFRIILKGSSANLSSFAEAKGKQVMLEPIGFPGMVVVHQGAGKPLKLAPSSTDKSSVFNVVAGLDGAKETVSFEQTNKKGCYIFSKENEKTVLGCYSGTPSYEFCHGVSFTVGKGISEYHPISFVAKGANRNFLLVPLLSLRDESYTIYFDV